jgi:hypothetical protein
MYADGSIEITIGADSTFLIDGVPLQDFCNAIKKCETKVELINLANGTYQFVNEAGVVSVMGYSFTCVNDSTIQLRDHDGTLVNSCVLRGGANPAFAAKTEKMKPLMNESLPRTSPATPFQ